VDDLRKERFVTVGEYSKTPEAYLARDRLRSEGIRAFLEGETGHELFASFTFSVIRLVVPASEAPRAVGILASCGEDDEPIEEPTGEEAEEGVWVCSICGDGVPLDLQACPSCGTARDALRTGAPRRRRRRRGADEDAILKKEENTTADVPPAPPPEPDPVLRVEADDLKLPGADTSKADELAGRLLLWALLGPLLFLFSVIHLYLGLLLGGLCMVYILLLLVEVLGHCRELSARGAMAVSFALLCIAPPVVFLFWVLAAMAQ
jgi:hypothetical protein